MADGPDGVAMQGEAAGAVTVDTGAAVDAMLWQAGDMVLSLLSFYAGMAHQGELSKGQHYLAAVLLIFALSVVASEILDFLRSMTARANLQQPWLAQVLIKSVLLLLAYLTGLFARVISGSVFGAPQTQPIGIESMAKPVVAIMLLLILFYESQMLQAPSTPILLLLEAPLAEDKHGPIKNT
jgi:hypothetical protein